MPLDETSALVTKLGWLGISQAWAGSFEALLHRDVSAVNQRLADACQPHVMLVPIGSINPELPSWETDLRRCVEVHAMPGIRLHPNYHGYSLSDERFIELLRQATAAGRFVQIAAAMEDTRTQHPLIQVPDVDLGPLPKAVASIDGCQVQILNSRPRPPLLQSLAACPAISWDTARVEATNGVATLLQHVPAERIMFGSHAPFLIPDAALIRVHESQLAEDKLQPLFWQNAERMKSGGQP